MHKLTVKAARKSIFSNSGFFLFSWNESWRFVFCWFVAWQNASSWLCWKVAWWQTRNKQKQTVATFLTCLCVSLHLLVHRIKWQCPHHHLYAFFFFFIICLFLWFFQKKPEDQDILKKDDDIDPVEGSSDVIGPDIDDVSIPRNLRIFFFSLNFFGSFGRLFQRCSGQRSRCGHVRGRLVSGVAAGVRWRRRQHFARQKTSSRYVVQRPRHCGGNGTSECVG